MTNAMQAESEIVATRTTFDGVTIYLHADGSVSDRLSFFRGKLPVASMWRAVGDVSAYAHAEIPEMIREAKAGKWSDAWLAESCKSAATKARIAAVPEADRVYVGRELSNGTTTYARVR